MDKRLIEQIAHFSKSNPAFKLIDPGTSLTEFSAILTKLTLQQSLDFKKITQLDIFFQIMDFKETDDKDKLSLLFKHAKRLGFDPNARYETDENLYQVHWKNTPLHLYLANENYELAEIFIDAASEHKVSINLNLADVDGKTPLMLAIKLGNGPIELIKKLITKENYNKSDKTGVTPLMMACAMRRIDIMKELIQCHATQLKMGPLDFEQLTTEQRLAIADFIIARDPKTGKSLGHYAVMRQGTLEELSKADDYQLTVMNIAKSVGIDARRDKKAVRNSPFDATSSPVAVSNKELQSFMKMKDMLPVIIQEPKLRKDLNIDQNQTLSIEFTELTYNGPKIKNALLASENNNWVIYLKAIEGREELLKIFQHQIQSYSGISYAEAILKRTESTLHFLKNLDFDFSLKQTNGKTAADYISNLKLEGNESFVTETDRKYLIHLERALKHFSLIKTDPSERILESIVESSEFRVILSKLTAAQMTTPLTHNGYFDFFRLCRGSDYALKMKEVFTHVKRLGIDPNAQVAYSEDVHGYWRNTALHIFLANECFSEALCFLREAKNNDVFINLNIQDTEGKTPLMLAIKLGNAPIELITKLLSAENYNLADNTGVTPLMFACALRRVDIMREIIQFHASTLGIKSLDFTQITDEQKEALADFINVTDAKTGKSLAHYAVLRHGTDEELAMKPTTYQLTVVNIAKSVGIDARRDKNAVANSPLIDRLPIYLSPEEIIKFSNRDKSISIENIDDEILKLFGLTSKPTTMACVCSAPKIYNENYLQHVLLSHKENMIMFCLKAIKYPELKEKLAEQVRNYCGVSYSETILERTTEVIELLIKMGHNFSLQQKDGNKTAADYLKNLMKPGNASAVTDVDRKYLFTLAKRLHELQEVSSRKILSNQK